MAVLWKKVQHSWKGGLFDQALMGRSDLAKYPESASLLENFIVKRQGCISKRRGTDELADLKNLLGGTIQPSKVKLIPLVYEKEEGYYVLMTQGRAFLAGKYGIRLMDGSWAREIEPYDFTDYNPDTEASNQEYVGSKPFSIRKFGYDTLQQAFDHATNGDIIKVRQDEATSAAVTVAKYIGNVTLDLNGHRLYCSSNGSLLTMNHETSSVCLRNSGPATYEMADGTQGEVGWLHDAARNVALVTVTKGSFILESGAYLYGTGQGASSNGVQVAAAGTFMMNGGRIQVYGNGVNVTSGGTALINNGTIVSTSQYVVSGGNSTARIRINDGTFTAPYGFNQNTDVYGGRWTVSKRLGYASDTVWGGCFELETNDIYYTKFPIYRACIRIGSEAPELEAALAAGNAVVNNPEAVTVYGLVWTGYHQPGEGNYTGTVATPKTDMNMAVPPVVYDGTKRPFYVNVPYADDDLDELDCCQSGDIIFLAHRRYPFASLEFEGMGLRYKIRSFTSERWERPMISKVAAGVGSKFPTEGSFKSVYYCCTYVKDGVESLPSQPYEFKYRLPWPNDSSVVITVDRGNNEEEPDYYNIYKKESTDFGLIGTIAMNLGVTAKPLVVSTNNTATTVVRQGYSWGPEAGQSKSLYAANPEWYLNRDQNGLLLGTFNNGSEGWGYQGVGGVKTPASILFDWGNLSGIVVSRFVLALDAHEFIAMETPTTVPNPNAENGTMSVNKKYVNWFAGRRFNVTLMTVDSDGVTKSFSKTVDVSSQPFYTVSGSMGNYTVEKKALAVGKNETLFPTQVGITDMSGVTYRHGIAEVNEYERFLDVDFTTELKAAYPKDSGDTSGGAKTNFSIAKITITGYADAAAHTADKSNPIYWHGVRFYNGYSSSDTYEDEYITPDMSITPPESKEHFSTSGEYPGCAAIYQQRLCLAASEGEPNGFWLSATGDLFNFDVHSSIRESDAISAQVAATEFPRINHMVMSKELMLFCDAAEWEVAPSSGNTLSYKTVSAKMQSSIGCKKELKPILVGDEILFAEANGQTIRAIRYNFVSDGYESTDLSVLSQEITKNNPIVQFAYQQNPDSLVWCVLKNGTLAVLVYMKEHEMVAWSTQKLGGGFMARGVASSKALSKGTTDVAILVERNGLYRLWRVRDDDPEMSGAAQVTMDGCRFFDTCEDHAEQDSDMMRVFLGNDTEAYGYPFEARLVTMPPEASDKETVRFEIQNATEMELLVLDSCSFVVRSYGVKKDHDQEVKIEPTLDASKGTVKLTTGKFRKVLHGLNDRDGRVVVKSAGVWPFTLLMLATTYQIELANEKTGGNQ